MNERRNCINKFDLQQVVEIFSLISLFIMNFLQTFTESLNETYVQIKNVYMQEIQFEVNLFLLNFSNGDDDDDDERSRKKPDGKSVEKIV